MTPALAPLLAAELRKPRPLPPQVIKHLGSTYGVSRDGVQEFLLGELPKLQDYELDLILSPAFTPSLQDQAVIADVLGRDSISDPEQTALISTLAALPIRAPLMGEETAPIEIELREVTIERYVRRLRLQGTIPPELFAQIESLSPASDRPMLKAIARRAIWNSPERIEILSRFFARTGQITRTADAVELLNLMEVYQPADRAELVRRLPQWMDVLHHEIGMASTPKPFFNERVQELHGGGRDQRRPENNRLAARQRELEFLMRLEGYLGI